MAKFGSMTPTSYAKGNGNRVVFTREDYLKAIEEDLLE